MVKKDDDFGFTAISQKDMDVTLKANTLAIKKAEDVRNNLTNLAGLANERYIELHNMIIPLLKNLRDSQGDYIKWPNRKDKINKVLEKISLIHDHHVDPTKLTSHEQDTIL